MTTGTLSATAPRLPFAGRRFDGRHARVRPVRFGFEGATLLLADADADDPEAAARASERVPLAAVHVAEPLQDAPRLFDLPGGGLLQADDGADLRAALRTAGVRISPVVRAQRAWPLALLALALLAAAFFWAWREGVPRAATLIAERIPPELEARMGDQVLATLDKRTLHPSTVAAARQQALRARFEAFLRQAGHTSVRRVEFRRLGDQDGGINAFALPGGTVVFLDGLVTLLDDDEEALLGVLAHEAAHQANRDMTRGLVRALGYAALAGLVWGDYSSVATNGAVIMGHLGHSRAAEERADEDAIGALRRAGVSPAGLARFLRRMEESARRRGQGAPAWLSTHPGLRERAERAEEAADEMSEEAAASAAGSAPR